METASPIAYRPGCAGAVTGEYAGGFNTEGRRWPRRGVERSRMRTNTGRWGRVPLLGAAAAAGLNFFLSYSHASDSHASESVLDALIAVARDAPPDAEGTKEYSKGVLRPVQLKTCLLTASRIDASGAVLDRELMAISALDKTIDETGGELQRESAGKFPTREQIDAFNTRVETYNQKVRERITRVGAYNKAIDDYSSLADAFERECSGKSYFPADLKAVRHGLPPEIQAALKQR